jgi:hypothetical protein
MGHLVSLALLVAAAAGSRTALAAGLSFVAAMACLAYVSAGVAKLRSGNWRGGAFLGAVLATEFWGGERLSSFATGSPWLVRLLERGVIVFELVFPIVLVLPLPAALAVLAMGVLFHLAVAVALGLNTFLWAFVATYPAILFVHARLATLLQ